MGYPQFYTLQEFNIDPGRGWMMSFYSKLVIFRVYVNLPGGISR